MTTVPFVDWRFWLVNASNLSQIADITSILKSKQLVLQLNSAGKLTGQMNLLQPITASIVEHQTAIIAYRNGTPVWSGPIFTTKESSNATSDILTITAMGWFQILNQRIIHTGAEFQAMKGTQPYSGIGTESATQIVYAAQQMRAIAHDLLLRANIDVPTSMSVGLAPNTNAVNLTLQQFQPVGQQILRLANVESGFDFDVDPITRALNVYYQTVVAGVTGKGVDRGRGILFTYPGNCSDAERDKDGTHTANRYEAIGQNVGVGRADDLVSQQQNGLFEDQGSLSDVVDNNILIAYANAEIVVRAQPWTVITVTPRPASAAIDTPTAAQYGTKIGAVPQPFQDYGIGDIVYAVIRRGPRMQIGVQTPQALRVFGFTISIDDSGIERVSGLQTTYSGAVS